MATTRFNPTCNGTLHLGHLYMALVNRAEGDRFILRLDDTSPHMRDAYGAKMLRRYGEMIAQELQDFGCIPDEVVFQSEVIEQVRTQIHVNWDHSLIMSAPRTAVFVGTTIPYQSYVPLITLEKVLMDYQSGVTDLIRGIEIISEYALYQYFWERYIQDSFIHHVYLPRLMHADGSEMVSISKTTGNFRLSILRRKYPILKILNLLAKACLIDPSLPWKVENVKPAPMLLDEYFLDA